MITVVYPVGTGSKNDNLELRWSLRSLDRFSVVPVNPVVVGHIPDWYAGDAIPCEDPTNRKEKNIMHKVLLAIREGAATGEFQISADDHFWLRPVDLSQLPVYFRQGIIPDNEKEPNNYAKSLMGTRTVLLEGGYPAINTTVHCNQWCHSDDVPEIAALLDRSISVPWANDFGLMVWAAWPNVGITKRRRPIRYKQDIKLGKTDRRKLESIAGSAPILSVNDDAFLSPDFVPFMEGLFGRPSKWERIVPSPASEEPPAFESTWTR